MPDLLHFGMDWLADKLREHVSRPVTYRRGASEIPVPATIGRTLMKLADGEGGVRMEWTDRDFLIRADALVIAGNRITPERGDTVVDDGKVYEVQFDDWMYLMDERVMLNKAVMSKFGFKLGEVTLAFTKQ